MVVALPRDQPTVTVTFSPPSFEPSCPPCPPDDKTGKVTVTVEFRVPIPGPSLVELPNRSLFSGARFLLRKTFREGFGQGNAL